MATTESKTTSPEMPMPPLVAILASPVKRRDEPCNTMQKDPQSQSKKELEESPNLNKPEAVGATKGAFSGLDPTTEIATGKGKYFTICLAIKMIIHVSFTVLFAALAAVFILRGLHDNYYLTLLDRAVRSDVDLLDEMTYYHRECNGVDVTAKTPQEAQQLYVNPNTEDGGVDQMMTHGAVLFPSLLGEDTAATLREFVVKRNMEVNGTDAEYPIMAGRLSYGIEATEDPRVVKALKEVHDNKALQKLLEGLVGKNPALTEITAITAYYGSEDQNWHSDVKSFGDATKWGRTYSHSYSLFIPLQNTTGDMGATDLCPGTHMCADIKMDAVCEKNKIGMHAVGKDGVHWKMGDAALLNQQVWHRGSSHTDPEALERVVFILSFIARPNDSRQLGKGAYFHMKWNMWGHTWQDIADSAVSMARPWCILRALHLWKPKDRQWGYDLLTAVAFRSANMEQGCEPEDVETFADKLWELGLPYFLHGTVNTTRDDAWRLYFRETIDNTWEFLLHANIIAITAFSLHISLRFARTRNKDSNEHSGSSAMRTSLRRLAITHGLVLALAAYTWNMTTSSLWARDIASGKTMMRPFPPPDHALHDGSLPDGPTILPWRYDVLIGTRLNVRTIGAYTRWMDFHPGNKEFLKFVADFDDLYRSYVTGLPPVFGESLVKEGIDRIERQDGKFLLQDYRDGVWIVLDSDDREEFVRGTLWIGRKTLLAYLKQEIDFLIGDYRFVHLFRESKLSRMSQSYLRDIETKLMGSASKMEKKETIPNQVPEGHRFLSPMSFVEKLSTELTSRNEYWASTKEIKDYWTSRWTQIPEIDRGSVLKVGQEIHVDRLGDGEDIFKGTIVGMSSDGQHYDLAFYEVSAYDWAPIVRGISREALLPTRRMVEGDEVFVLDPQTDKFLPATLDVVWADYSADVAFDNGETESGVPMDDIIQY